MREIIILGRASGWEKAPEGECWAVHSAIPHRLFQGRNISRSFDLHHMENRSVQIKLNNLIRQNEIPYYLQDVDSTIPTSVKYPLKEVIERFKTDYFSCSIAYMIALALYEGVDKINVYGVNMAKGTERIEQKSCVEFWLGIAIGMGVEVIVHGQNSALLVVVGPYGKRKLYGYCTKQKSYSGVKGED